MQQASPSLRSMAASAYTFEGQRERGFIDAEIASAPGWRGKVIKTLAIISLGLFVIGLLVSLLSR